MMVLPSAIDMTATQANMRGHALTLDTKRGDFYFEYVVKQHDLNNQTHNVVKFVKGANGTYVQLERIFMVASTLSVANGDSPIKSHTRSNWVRALLNDVLRVALTF